MFDLKSAGMAEIASNFVSSSFASSFYSIVPIFSKTGQVIPYLKANFRIAHKCAMSQCHSQNTIQINS